MTRLILLGFLQGLERGQQCTTLYFPSRLGWLDYVRPQNASAGCVSPSRVSVHQAFIAGTMSADPFVNLPHLREKLIPADKSTLRVTPEALAVWDQRARDSGRPANWRLPDDVREASRNAVLGNRDASE